VYLQPLFTAVTLLELVAGVVQILDHSCQFAEVTIINGCVEGESQRFVSLEAVDGLRADVTADVEDGVDGVDLGRRKSGRQDVDVDCRSPQVFEDHAVEFGGNALEACSGRVGGNLMIFCTELSSVRKTGSGTRSQPGLRKVRGDGSDIGVSVFGLNRLRSSRDGRKFVS
jgi:hypothetical protein